MNTKTLAVHRAKLTHAVASPQEQAAQLDALRGVIAALLGLGTDTGGGAVLGPQITPKGARALIPCF